MKARIPAAVMIMAAVGGCCGYYARTRVPTLDFFERYVIIDIGTPPDCALPRRRTEPARAIRTGAPVKVWLRSVAATDVRRPLQDTAVRLSVVTSFGAPAHNATITPSTVRTGPDGFATQPIELHVTSDLDHYRIKAEFADKEAVGVTYSPFLIPMGAATSGDESARLAATTCGQPERLGTR